MGKGTFKAYEKGEWGRDVVAAWGFVDFPPPLGRGNMEIILILDVIVFQRHLKHSSI